MRIPFTKAHGAKNDFLLTWREDAQAAAQIPAQGAAQAGYAAVARAICDRHTGIGADGWLLVDPAADAQAEGSIELYNSDGSTAGISGNGTRCAAAFLIHNGRIHQGHAADVLRVRTGAGIKTLRLLQHTGLQFEFEMNMGRAEITAERFRLQLSQGACEVTLLWVGNPQCAIVVEDFDFDWRALGAEIESHPHFPHRTNVSFLKPLDEHTIDVRFYERGAGPTMSSGTGSTGAAATAVARGLAASPVRVLTAAGPIDVRLEDEIYLTGPVEIVAQGEYYAY